MTRLRNLLSSANPLFVLEAVARLGSFTTAAAELNVTQPAVSRTLSRLERDLGCQLFDRSATGAKPTAEGQVLSRAVSGGFQTIEAAIRQIHRMRSSQDAVTLSVSSGFAAHWLMPRLTELQKRFPSVDLRFQLISGRLEGVITGVDLGMRFTIADDPHHQCWPFAPEELLAVCSEGYRAAHGMLDDAGSVARQTLIDHSLSGVRWPEFRQRLGLPGGLPNASLEFSDYAVVLQAAMLGQGIAIGWTSVASYALRTGQLVPACNRVFRTGRLLQIVAPRDVALRSSVAALRDWLLTEMHSDMTTIRARYPFLGLSI